MAEDNRQCFGTRETLHEADKNLPHDKNNFFKDLDFNKATFSKLVKIGSHSRLQTDPVKSLLPPNYTIVYKVAMLSRQDRHRRNVRARFSCGKFFRPAVLQDGTRSVATTHEFRSVRGLHLVRIKSKGVRISTFQLP